jgi:hypothetical protein
LLSAKKIRAGKSGQVEVRITTETLSGPVEKLVNIRTNDPGHSVVTLSIRAVIDPEIWVSAQDIDFGSAPKGKSLAREITLTIGASRAIKILSAESSDPFVSVKLEPVPDSNGKTYKLTAVQRANGRSGYHLGRILVKTDSRLTPHISIFERGTVGK